MDTCTASARTGQTCEALSSSAAGLFCPGPEGRILISLPASSPHKAKALLKRSFGQEKIQLSGCRASKSKALAQSYFSTTTGLPTYAASECCPHAEPGRELSCSLQTQKGGRL